MALLGKSQKYNSEQSALHNDVRRKPLEHAQSVWLLRFQVAFMLLVGLLFVLAALTLCAAFSQWH